MEKKSPHERMKERKKEKETMSTKCIKRDQINRLMGGCACAWIKSIFMCFQ